MDHWVIPATNRKEDSSRQSETGGPGRARGLARADLKFGHYTSTLLFEVFCPGGRRFLEFAVPFLELATGAGVVEKKVARFHSVDGPGGDRDLRASRNETPVVNHQTIAKDAFFSSAINRKTSGNCIGRATVVLMNEPACSLFVWGKLRLADLDLVLFFRQGQVLAIGIDDVSEPVWADVHLL
jgi:hypothetical protein